MSTPLSSHPSVLPGSLAKAGGRQAPIQVSRDAGFLETGMGARLRGHEAKPTDEANDLLLTHGIILPWVLPNSL